MQSLSEEFWEGILKEVQEEGVVGEGRDIEADLGEVVEILKSSVVLEIDTVIDQVGSEEASNQVLCRTGFTTVRTEGHRG